MSRFNDPAPAATCPRRARGRSLILGVAAGLAVVWLFVLGFFLMRGEVDDAIITGVAFLCSMVAVVLPLIGDGRRR